MVYAKNRLRQHLNNKRGSHYKHSHAIDYAHRNTLSSFSILDRISCVTRSHTSEASTHRVVIASTFKACQNTSTLPQTRISRTWSVRGPWRTNVYMNRTRRMSTPLHFVPLIVFGPARVVDPVAGLKNFGDSIQTSIIVHDQLPAAVRTATDTYVL